MAAEPARKESVRQAAAPAAKAAKPRSPAPLIIIAVVLLAAAGGGGWWAVKARAAVAHAGATAPRAAPIYYKLDPAFVVNFGGPGSARYFQVTVEAMSRDQSILDVLKNNDPAVRNDLILLFSSQDAATLMSTDGKEKLRAATLAAIRKVLDESGANGNLLEQVYFTSFVIQ